MSSQDTQAQLFGEPSGNSATIETSGRVVRPLMAIPDAIVDEARFHVDSDGIHTKAVEAANVATVELRAFPSAFDGFDVSGDAFTAGLTFNSLTTQLANARMGKATDDAVALEIDGTRTLVETEREYTLTTLTQTNEVLNIDPSTIREEPEIPDLSLPCEATVDVQALVDALDSVNRVSEHAVVRERDGDLIIAGEADDDDGHTGEYGTVANFGEVVEARGDDAPDGEVSKFSLDYLRDMVEGLKAGKVDEVTIAWGQEIPIKLEFQRTIDEQVAYGGEYMLAPRIHK